MKTLMKFLKDGQAGVIGLIVGALVFIIGFLVYGNVYNALNFSIFSTSVQNLLPIIALVLIGVFMISLVVNAFRTLM
jgi:hypothetical protein